MIDPKNDRIRVIDTKSSKFGVPYAALCHRWSRKDFFKSLRSNIVKLQGASSVPLSSLTPTFQDAVKITRDLGLRHLWIDSLCVVQDNFDDWNAEASSMADVYGNAQLTLAFNTDSETAQSPIESLTERMFNNISSARPNYFLHINGEGYLELDEEWDLERCIDVSLLKSRGWCYQERLLSKRLVHIFSGNEWVTTISGSHPCGSPRRT